MIDYIPLSCMARFSDRDSLLRTFRKIIACNTPRIKIKICERLNPVILAMASAIMETDEIPIASKTKTR
jgi:hypothetical protein